MDAYMVRTAGGALAARGEHASRDQDQVEHAGTDVEMDGDAMKSQQTTLNLFSPIVAGTMATCCALSIPPDQLPSSVASTSMQRGVVNCFLENTKANGLSLIHI